MTQRVRPLLLLSMLSLLGTGGCFWLGVGQAAVAILPVITDRNAPAPESHDRPLAAVPDAGLSWRRTVTGPTGRPLTGPVTPGDQVTVRWEIPVQVGPNVNAITALSDRGCHLGVNPPTRWSLRSGSGIARGGEAWAMGVAGSGTSVEAVGADALRDRLGVTPATPLSWLLMVPGEGRYVLVVEWETVEPDRLDTLVPCVGSWLAVPLPLAVAATRSLPPAPVAVRSGVRVTPDTSDMGVSSAPRADQAAPATTSAPSRRPAPRAPVDVGLVVRRTIGLLGSPGYDLMRLHQAALDLEFSPSATLATAPDGTPIGADDPAVRSALHAARDNSLAALRGAGAEGHMQLCTLVHQGLGARPMGLWDNQPTVPQSDQRDCVKDH